MFMRHIIRPEGLRAHLRVETVPKRQYNFARIGRQSGSVALDKIFVRGNSELTDSQLFGMIVFDEMRQVVQRLDKAARDVVWNGDTDNSFPGSFQECDGVLKQIGGAARVIDGADHIAIEKKIKECGQDHSAMWYIAGWRVPQKWRQLLQYWRVSGCPISEAGKNGVQDIYILPIGKEGCRDNGIYEQRVDYRSGKTRPDEAYFWTDGGEFLWQPRQQNWDFEIDCQTEFRIVVPMPELVTVIKNVPVVYLPREEQVCQQ